MVEKSSKEGVNFTFREATMADRKDPRVKLPYKINVGLLKTSIKQDISSSITVFQDLGNNEYLVELDSREGADACWCSTPVWLFY